MNVAYLTRQKNNAIEICDQNIITAMQRGHGLKFNVFGFTYQVLELLKPDVLSNIILKLCTVYKKCDVLHISTFDKFFVFITPFLKLINVILIKKFVLTIYHSEIELHSKPVQFLLKKIIKQFDAYVVPTTFTKNQLLQYGIDSQKVYVLPPGVSPKIKFQTLPKIDNDYMLYVGGEYPRKNLPVLFKAFAAYQASRPDSRLLFIKIGHSEVNTDYAKNTDELIKNLKINEKVKVIRNYLSETELSSYYSNAVFYICSSTLEGFGLPVLEAMRCKCIPLVSKIETFLSLGLPEICYVENFRSSSEWIKKFHQLRTLPANKKEELKDIVYQISLTYTWENYTNRLQNIYEILLKTSK